MGYKIGRYTAGIAIVTLGLLFLLHQFTDRDWLKLALMLWPFILIGYGVEFLLVTRKQQTYRFDLGGILLLIFLYIGLIIYTFFGLVFMQFDGPKYAVPGETITVAKDEVQRLRVNSVFGNVRVEATEDDQVTIIPIYRSSRNLPLEEMMNKADFNVTVKSGILNIQNEANAQYRFFNIFKGPVSVDIKIYAPKELATRIEHTFGHVDVQGMERLEAVRLDFGVVNLENVHSNVDVEVNFGILNVQDFIGAIQAEVDFGKVEVEGDVAGPWDIGTNFGAIKMVIPRSSSISYSFEVDIGKRDIPNPPFANKDYGILNDGTYPLRAEVDFGLIDVEFSN